MSTLQSCLNQTASFFSSRKGSVVVAALLLAIFFLNSMFSILGKSLTYDEPYHYRYGVNILNGDATRFDDSKMPFSAWNALPAKLASFLPEGNLKSSLEKTVAARLMTTLFSMLAAFVVFYWGRELYGVVPAWISLGLYVFDPNIIAHSQLITTDIYVTGMVLISSFWLWKFAKTRSWLDGILCAAMLGLAQLAKYTAVSLLPLLAVVFFASDWPRLYQSVRLAGMQSAYKEPLRYLKYALIVAVIVIVIINLGFLFDRTFVNIKDYDLKAGIFQSIQSKTSFVIPTAYPYLEGLDWITAKERTDLGFIHIYLLGETRFGEGFPGYYLIASALKVPIATQIVVVMSLVVYFLDRQRRSSFLKNEWFLLGLVLFYSVYFNFFYKAQIGIRYYLVIFPLLYVFAGVLFVNWQRFSRIKAGLAISLGIFLVGSVFSQYPNYLSYFNEFINQKDAYKYLADSNLEWGQDFYLLEDYMRNNEKAQKAPEIPGLISETTTYFVSVNRLVGVIAGPENYMWLRENFEPVDMIGNSYLIYRIAPDEMKQLCSTTAFCK